MASVKLYNKTGDDKAREVQGLLERKFGFVPETFQAMGRSGNFLEAVLKLDQAAGKNLDAKTKQLICVAVSAAAGCGYCVDAHVAIAKQSGASDDEISGAMEVAAMMSLFSTFNKASGLNHDIKAD